jgi:hypothetical protein
MCLNRQCSSCQESKDGTPGDNPSKEGGRVWRGAGVVYKGATRDLLLMAVTGISDTTQTENIKQFKQCVGSECTVRMFVGWVVATQSFAKTSCACAAIAFLAGTVVGELYMSLLLTVIPTSVVG